MEIKLLVDYLTMSFKVSSDRLECFTNWLFRKINFPLCDAVHGTSQLRGYTECYYYQGIKIHRRSGEICFECSGSGCRMVEELNKQWDWYGFIYFFKNELTKPMKGTENTYFANVSRIDAACDLLNNEKITLPFLQKYVLENKFICKSVDHKCIIGNSEMSVYFGSPRSNRRLRIYDKALEQGEQDKKKWVRFEFQLRNECAMSYLLNLFNYDGNFTVTYYGMLHEYLRFITKPNDGMHSDRKITCRWWLDFLHDVERIKQLYLPGASYGMSNISRFYTRGCASTVRALLESDIDVSDLVVAALNTPLNSRQADALDKYKKSMTDEEKASENSGKILEAIYGKVVEKGTVSHVEKMAMLYSKRTELKDKIRKDYCEYWGVPDPEEEEFKRCADEDLSFDV